MGGPSMTWRLPLCQRTSAGRRQMAQVRLGWLLVVLMALMALLEMPAADCG